MPTYSSIGASIPPAANLQPVPSPHGQHLACQHCRYLLECVDQSRRTGTWLGSLICPNCRSEYFYAYRWGQLVKKM